MTTQAQTQNGELPPLLPLREARRRNRCMDCQGPHPRLVAFRQASEAGGWTRMFACAWCAAEAEQAGLVVLRSVA